MAFDNGAKIDAMNTVLHDVAALPEYEAQCLPGRFYTDPDYFRYEVDTFLSRESHALGRADEIPKPGDYFVTQLFDEPLLVVRSDDDEVRILSNLCRHCGMPLVEGTGSTRRFVCALRRVTRRQDSLHRVTTRAQSGISTDTSAGKSQRSAHRCGRWPEADIKPRPGVDPGHLPVRSPNCGEQLSLVAQ